MRYCHIWFCLALLSAAVASGEDEILVRVWCGSSSTTTLHDAGASIDINVGESAGCPDHVNIYDNSGNPVHNIGPVYLYGSRASPIEVTMGSGGWRGLDDTQHGSATSGDWAGITVANGLDDLVYLEGHVGGDLTGLIRVGEIYRLDIDGQIQAGIQADHDGLGPFWLYAGSMSSTGNANSPNDSITRVETLIGNLAGSVTAGGNIGDIVVKGSITVGSTNPDIGAGGDITLIQTSEDIGEPGDPVSIEAGGTIKYIYVPAGDLYANITAATIERAPGGNEQSVYVAGSMIGTTITLTDAIRDNFTIIGGDFAQDSVLRAWAIGDQAKFQVLKDATGGGYVKGDITFTGNLSPQSPFTIDESLEGTLNIGLHLWDTVTINGISSNGDGLVGQIIVNGTNTIGEWRSPVVVGGTTLAPVPYYNNKSATFGGGAVGLVPFNCHLWDCNPVASQPYLAECDPGYNVIKKVQPGGQVSSVTLSHYGPIVQVGTGKPFRVKAKSIGDTGCNWLEITDQGGSPFTYQMHPGNDREIKIIGPFVPGYDYLIEPKRDTQAANYLMCGQIGSTVALEDYDYRLRVFVIQDLNLSGGLDTGDITAWIDNPTDTTLDGVADSADLIDVTEAVVNHGE